MKKRRIAVVSGSRADYGLLYWIIKGIKEGKGLDLKLIVTGSHLIKRYGETVKEIEKDGFPIAARIRISKGSDSPVSIAKSIGRAVEGFAAAYERLKPDIILVLGDRFEILAAVSAALPFRIPIAHIHGGESTEGLIDEAIRHSVTKMSHLHFTSARQYAERVAKMGEDPANIFCFGAPGLDNIRNLNLSGREELLKDLGLPHGMKIGVVTYHPVTLEKGTAGQQTRELLAAISRITGVFWVFTLPNIDTEASAITGRVILFSKKNPQRAKVFVSLGRLRYLSLLKMADVMVGNSSSGLIEAPSFSLPVVNIGDRQRGRARGRNVIDVTFCERKAIERAIRKALSASFRKSLEGMKNPYGNGKASRKIVNKLKTVVLDDKLLKRRFHG
ncbi:MAG: UDP-N-acetylglucosamine 2-epimerase [Candidatus Omnitrophota bacterium]